MKHTMKYLLIYSGIISVLGGVSVKANEERPTYQLEEVVVTATATPVKKQDTYASVATITQDEIKRNHYDTLYEALQHIPSVHTVLYADGVGFEVSGESNPTLRGTRKIVVLVDGVNQNLGLGFRSGATNYNMDDIDHIEILRGSASTLYGANAVGGVINIVTKKFVAGENSISNSISYKTGSYGLNQFHASSIGSNGKLFWAFSGNKKYSGDMKDGNGNRRHSLSNADTGNFKIGTHLSDVTDAVFTYDRNFQHMEWVRPYTLYNETGDGLLSMYRMTFTLDYNSSDGKEGNQLSFYKGVIDSQRYYHHKGKLGKDGQLHFSESKELFTGVSYNISDRYYKQLSDEHRLATGFEWKKTEEDEITMKEWSIYAQDEWNITDKLKLTVGGRYVKPTDYKDRTLYSASLGYKVNDKVSLYVDSNEFYITPTSTQVYGNYTNGGGYWPNPNIKATHGRTNEIGANIIIDDKTFLDFNIYRRVQDDALAPGYIDGKSVWVNISGKSATSGGELSISHTFGKYTTLNLGYAHLNADSLSMIPRSPHDQFTFGLSYIRNSFDISIEGIGRYDIVPTSRFLNNHKKYLPESTYWLWNMAVNYKLDDSKRIFFRVNNILDLYYMTATPFDTTVSEMAYYTCPGRNFEIGMTYNF